MIKTKWLKKIFFLKSNEHWLILVFFFFWLVREPLQYSFTIDFIWIYRQRTMKWCDSLSLKFIRYGPMEMLLHSSIAILSAYFRMSIFFIHIIFFFLSFLFFCVCFIFFAYDFFFFIVWLYSKFTYANEFVICWIKFSLSNWKTSNEYFFFFLCVCVSMNIVTESKSVHTSNHPTRVEIYERNNFFICARLWAMPNCHSVMGNFLFIYVFVDFFSRFHFLTPHTTFIQFLTTTCTLSFPISTHFRFTVWIDSLFIFIRL